MLYNGLGYEQLRWLALSAFGGTHQTKNPRGFSKVVQNKQLAIASMKKSYLNLSSPNPRRLLFIGYPLLGLVFY